MSDEDRCRVCPHVRRDHIMAGSLRDWNRHGDWCTVCQKGCKE